MKQSQLTSSRNPLGHPHFSEETIFVRIFAANNTENNYSINLEQ